MAEHKTQKLEREYVIPLRRFWVNVPHYERTSKAVKTIKKFIAKHMKVPDRDVNKVKLDVYFNNELWFRGRTNPPAKIKVKAVKEGDIVRVTFVEIPEYVKFIKSKDEKRHKKSDKKSQKEDKAETPKEEKTEEEKKAEKEKEISSAEAKAKEAKQDLKAEKHLSKVKEESHHRMALQK